MINLSREPIFLSTNRLMKINRNFFDKTDQIEVFLWTEINEENHKWLRCPRVWFQTSYFLRDKWVWGSGKGFVLVLCTSNTALSHSWGILPMAHTFHREEKTIDVKRKVQDHLFSGLFPLAFAMFVWRNKFLLFACTVLLMRNTRRTELFNVLIILLIGKLDFFVGFSSNRWIWT